MDIFELDNLIYRWYNS